MDFSFSEEQRLIRRTARDFANNELVPRAAEHDRTAAFTAEQVRRLGELGFLGMQVPEEYGGAGRDTISYVLAMEEVSRGDAATSVSMTVQNSLVNWPLTKFGSEEQKRHYLPRLASGEILGCFALTEPVAGSDPAGMSTIATEDGDAYLLNGAKIFISNGGVSELALVWAQTNPALRHKGVTCFLLDRDMAGFEVGAEEH